MPMSTRMTPEAVRRLAWAMLVVTVAAGAALTLLLALGLADPPRAGRLAWQAQSPADWTLFQQDSSLTLLLAPIPLPPVPFTLELDAENTGRASSAWGLWLETAAQPHFFLVSREGYASIGAALDWFQFIHARGPRDHLYAHVEAAGQITLRINSEIVGHDALLWDSQPRWGVALYASPRLLWHSVRIYAPELITP